MLEIRRDSSDTLAGLLDDVEGVLSEPSTVRTRELSNLRELRERLLQKRLHLAVLGQFKRGKSTLLNALLDAKILPAAVTPLTAIPTFIAFGSRPEIREVYISGGAKDLATDDVAGLAKELARLVTEESNPENRLGLARVEARLPAPILDRDVTLIDPPGIGSTFRHNTKTMEAVLPACDVALFVVSPDPPLTELEAAFLARVHANVARLIVVMNKTDVVEPQDLARAVAFLRQTLANQGVSTDEMPIFCLSARAALRARVSHDALALEFANGKIVPVTRLRPGQRATVLQLPVRSSASAGEFPRARATLIPGEGTRRR